MNDEIYLSNGGKGKGIARIVSIENGVVALARKSSPSAKHWTPFTLTEKFFNSPSCGWRAPRKAAKR